MNSIEERESQIKDMTRATGATLDHPAYKVRIYTREWGKHRFIHIYSYKSLREFLADFRDSACAGDCDPEYVEVVAVQKARVIWHNQQRCNKTLVEVQ